MAQKREYTEEQRIKHNAVCSAYYWANRDDVRAYKKKYRETHLEEKRRKDAEYRASHREQINKKNAEWRAKNREAIRLRERKYYARNRDKMVARKERGRIISGVCKKPKHNVVVGDMIVAEIINGVAIQLETPIPTVRGAMAQIEMRNDAVKKIDYDELNSRLEDQLKQYRENAMEA